MRKRFFLWTLALTLALLALLPALGEEEDWGLYIVVEDQDLLPPDVSRQAEALMGLMTDTEKVYQLFIVSPEMLTGEGRTSALGSVNVLAARPVGGVILFGQNIESEARLRQLIADLQTQAALAGIFPLFIAVDEEGGIVSRVANKLGYALADAPETIGQAENENAAYTAGAYIASYLSPLGINLDFAPTADTVIDSPGVGVQSYGGDAYLVSRMVAAMAEGLRQGGVIPCYTHFPGHGAKEGSTIGALSVRRTEEEMRAKEWIPFRDGASAGIEMILVSHAYLRTQGETIPASLSYQAVTGFLRGQIGYDGVIVTDSLRMTAVTKDYKAGQAAVQAIQAGADILLLPADLDAAAQGVFKALNSGQLTMERIEESVRRILMVKIQSGLIR